MTQDEEAFDAIVVGAGLAGIACAHRLALAGRSVVLIERGSTPGSKNAGGGRLYTYALEAVEAGLTREAPWERAVVREQVIVMDADRSMAVCRDCWAWTRSRSTRTSRTSSSTRRSAQPAAPSPACRRVPRSAMSWAPAAR